MRLLFVIFALGATGLAHAENAASNIDGQPSLTQRELRRLSRMSPPRQAPADKTNRFAADPDAAAFGQMIFFDSRFSSDGSVSCATCHQPDRAFTDGRPVAKGLGTGRRNTPSLLSVGSNRWFGWGGEADTLWSIVLHAIEDPNEHGSSRSAVAHLILEDPVLRREYESIFGRVPDEEILSRVPRDARPDDANPSAAHHLAWTKMTASDQRAVNEMFANIGKALAAYQRRLQPGPSAFDRWISGLQQDDADKISAVTPAAVRGAKLFVGKANCWLCHSGAMLSDGEFHNIGVPPVEGDRPTDPGRYAGIDQVKSDPFNAIGEFSDDRSGDEADSVTMLERSPETWGQFKTPSLRNVTRTSPYMHGGQITSLAEVLQFYSTREGAVQIGHHQEQILQPLHLSPGELDDLLAFLESLTSPPLDPHLLAPPKQQNTPDSR